MNVRKEDKMEYVLLSVLLLSALFIIAAVVFQKSEDEGLSSTIAGGSETYYGKEKSQNADKMLFKWTLIASIVFAVAVIAAYVIQPDYTYGVDLEYWKDLSEFSGMLK